MKHLVGNFHVIRLQNDQLQVVGTADLKAYGVDVRPSVNKVIGPDHVWYAEALEILAKDERKARARAKPRRRHAA